MQEQERGEAQISELAEHATGSLREQEEAESGDLYP